MKNPSAKPKILFVCHGNICRSPMAEFIMKDLLQKSHMESLFHIESAATSTEEIGNSVYPPAARILQRHGIFPRGKTARQISRFDFDSSDYIVLMDKNNLSNLRRLFGDAYKWDEAGRPHHERRLKKVSFLMDYTDTPHDVADPWYSGDFTATWDDIFRGCSGMFNLLCASANAR